MTQETNPTQGEPKISDQSTPQRASGKRRPILIVVLVLVLVACIAGASYGIWQIVTTEQQIESAQNEEKIVPTIPDSSSSSAASSQAAPKLEKNPINFAELKKQNADIYAWIYVPGTNVNHAIVRHPTDNEFYLNHDETQQESELGAVFTEDYNTTDFKDAVTLVYGHNIRDGLMFSTLHYFEDAAFFDENDKFYVYTPGHIYTYKIVSAYTTDDRHVLYHYNYFQSFDDLRAFEKEIRDPHSIQQNTRDVKLDDSSKIVVMSTCNSGALEEHGRYLVCGVMTNDQPTE